jgi:hypothetical protein
VSAGGPSGESANEHAIRLLALLLARLEAAHTWVAEQETIFANKRGEVWPVLKLVSTWENTATRLLQELLLTPMSRSRLRSDGAGGGEALRAHLAEHYDGQQEAIVDGD